MIKLPLLLTAAASLAAAQSPSGLLTGPVTYTSTLTSGNPYGDKTIWLVKNPDGTTYTCSAAGTPSCYIVPQANIFYENLQASDGTSNGIPFCYTWYYAELILNDVGYCQTSFHGGGSGETRVAISCHQASEQSTNTNGTFQLTCVGDFGGTAIQVIGGVDVPITTQFNISTTVQYHPVTVWIPPHFRSPGHWATWLQVDSMATDVAPIPGT